MDTAGHHSLSLTNSTSGYRGAGLATAQSRFRLLSITPWARGPHWQLCDPYASGNPLPRATAA
eukprot:52299-Eustigmatos_ZCMA.PRE.1